MDERKLVNLKIKIRVAAKIGCCLLITAGAFLAAFYFGSIEDSEKSVYGSLGENSGADTDGTLLPPLPFAGNPPISALKK